MPETWRGEAKTATLVRVSPTRRALLIGLDYAIVDAGRIVDHFPMQLQYRVRTFRGMTLAQAWLLIRDEGADGIPSLMDIGNRLLIDWQDAAGIRRIPIDQEFGP